MNKKEKKVVLGLLKYVDGSTSQTEVVTNVYAYGILFDPSTGLWHCTNNTTGWWGKTIIGTHQLYVEKDNIRTNVYLGIPGAGICLFNMADRKQVEEIADIALEAITLVRTQ